MPNLEGEIMDFKQYAEDKAPRKTFSCCMNGSSIQATGYDVDSTTLLRDQLESREIA